MADPTMTGTMQLPPDSTEDPRGFGGTPDPEPMEDADGNIPATEAEQLDYDLLTVRARKVMFGKGKNKILKMLGTSEAPAQAIGKVGSMLVKSLMTSAKESGREISGDVAINAGGEIANDLNDLGKANGVFVYDDPESEKSELADAMLWGVKYYGDGMLAANEISPEMQKLAQDEVEEGLTEEQGREPRKTPIAEGVAQAVGNASPAGPGQGLNMAPDIPDNPRSSMGQNPAGVVGGRMMPGGA